MNIHIDLHFQMQIEVCIFIFLCIYSVSLSQDYCSAGKNTDIENDKVCNIGLPINKLDDVELDLLDNKEINGKWQKTLNMINDALTNYQPCDPTKCSCHYPTIKNDLKIFHDGITKSQINEAFTERMTLYQIINHKLFRSDKCSFPSRCRGIEYFILKIIKKLPDMEFVVNTADWPRVHSNFQKLIPVFSFSKTSEYIDITYPAWTFREGGPAIKLYPTGLGNWDKLRQSLMKESQKWPWNKKLDKAFFRGSRTSSERDALIYLSRKNPSRVDAAYTKNQAWKSDADTLYEPPAEEATLEDHCQFKYLFNYRGVAASFRLKHLFMCNSVVVHVGQEWTEFFYQQMKPWVHFIPLPSKASEQQIEEVLRFARENDAICEQIASRGFLFIRDHLRIKDVLCYWKKLLKSYAKLLNYSPTKRDDVIHISNL